MATQKLELNVNLENGKVVSGNIGPIHKVRVRRYFELRQIGALKNKALDLDERDSAGKLIHFPITIWTDGVQSQLADHDEIKAWLRAKHDDPELEPGPLEWIPNADQYVQALFTRKVMSPNVIEYVSSAASANMVMQDEMLLVDADGKIVSVIDPETNKPRKGTLTCEDYSGSVMEFTLWLNEKYKLTGGPLSNFAIHRLLRASGAIEEICYRHVLGKDLGKTPETLEIKFTPASTDPGPPHATKRAYVVGPDGQLVSFNPVPGTEIDWLPIVLIDKPGFAQTVRGLHGNDDAPGIIQALMSYDPPTEGFTTDPEYHWRYAGNGLWFEAKRPGGGVLELQATHVLWKEEDD